MKPPAIRSADRESASLFFWFRYIGDKFNFLKHKRERRCWLQEPCHTGTNEGLSSKDGSAFVD
uniref:Uncharacterized protein n=1 Tax=Helianthus annuus TaxID=4232 RepID=A0A251TRA3_HELAN